MLIEEKSRAPGILNKSNYKPKKYVNLVRKKKKKEFPCLLKILEIIQFPWILKILVFLYYSITIKQNFHWVLSASVSLRYTDS